MGDVRVAEGAIEVNRSIDAGLLIFTILFLLVLSSDV